MKQYEVYHRLMRDAQVYSGDSLSDSIDIYDEEHEDNWVDFSGDPLIDVVDAEDEYEATAKVANETGYHNGNLYAKEHIVSADGKVTIFGKEHPFRMEAGRFDEGDLTGIAVTLPDGREAKIAVNRKTTELSFTVADPENPDASEKVIKLEDAEQEIKEKELYTVTGLDGTCTVHKTRKEAYEALQKYYEDTLRIFHGSQDENDKPIKHWITNDGALIVTKDLRSFAWLLSKQGLQ